MLFPHAIFISYVVMIFIGLQGISLIVLLVKLSDNQPDRLFTTNRNFILVSLLLGILYFITYYNDLVIGDFKTCLLYRLFDGMIFYALGFSWIKVIDGWVSCESKKMQSFRKFTNFLFFSLMVISALSYGIFLDEFYNAKNFYGNLFMVFLELLLVFIVLIFTLIYMKFISREMLDKESKSYLKVVSILVNISVIWNSLVVFLIFIDWMHVSILSMYSYGITSVFILVINFYVSKYLYKKNMDVIYGRRANEKLEEASEDHKEKSAEERLHEVVLKYKLTERESEILRLAYRGLTNPEIGEELCISKHTAKRHMHNIFEKLHVTTRLEMVHLINGKEQ